jgi:hypothetical protein
MDDALLLMTPPQLSDTSNTPQHTCKRCESRYVSRKVWCHGVEKLDSNYHGHYNNACCGRAECHVAELNSASNQELYTKRGVATLQQEQFIFATDI